MLDPELVSDIEQFSASLLAHMDHADENKWSISIRVNEMWPEHQGIFQGEKMDYYAECSRVANKALRKPVFAESGNTLKKWCEVAAAYQSFPEAASLLEETSFAHLEIAKSLAYNRKVSSPLKALSVAMKENWTADEMKHHFDPPLPVHPYDMLIGYLSYMADHAKWEFIKSVEVKEKVLEHVSAINITVREYVESEGKAV